MHFLAFQMWFPQLAFSVRKENDIVKNAFACLSVTWEIKRSLIFWHKCYYIIVILCKFSFKIKNIYILKKENCTNHSVNVHSCTSSFSGLFLESTSTWRDIVSPILFLFDSRSSSDEREWNYFLFNQSPSDGK